MDGLAEEEYQTQYQQLQESLPFGIHICFKDYLQQKRFYPVFLRTPIKNLVSVIESMSMIIPLSLPWVYCD